jgi:tetratricopeptide (TPR) repeat protein
MFALKKIEINKRDHKTHLQMGNILSLEGKYSEAIEWFKISLSLNNQDSLAYLSLGFLLYRVGRI